MRTPSVPAVNSSAAASASSTNDQFMLLLKLVGSAVIPYQVQLDHAVTMPIKDGSIEASTPKYIVQQYLAATGGLAALNAVNSMYVVGQVKMVVASDVERSTDNVKRSWKAGGFVLWQKNTDLWFLELVVSGFKISAGSYGKIAWSQSSTNSNASRGPPLPLRRFFQILGNTQEAFESYSNIIKRNLADESSLAVSTNNFVALKGHKDASDGLRKLDKLIEKSEGPLTFHLARDLDLKLSQKQKEAIFVNRLLLLLHSNKVDQVIQLRLHNRFINL